MSGQPARAARARPAIVEVSGVSKRFGTSQALQRRLDARPGRRFAGAGRPKRRRQIDAGRRADRHAWRPTPGSVRFGGEDAPGLAERQKWRERVACVYQKSTVIPTLTVAENLLLNAQPTGGSAGSAGRALRREARARAGRRGASSSTSSRTRASSRSSSGRSSRSRGRCVQGTRFIILDEPTAELEGARGARGCSSASPHLQSDRRHVPLHLALPGGDLRDLPHA